MKITKLRTIQYIYGLIFGKLFKCKGVISIFFDIINNLISSSTKHFISKCIPYGREKVILTLNRQYHEETKAIGEQMRSLLRVSTDFFNILF